MEISDQRCSYESNASLISREEVNHLDFLTIDHWDDELWKKASIVYQQAFGKSGGKPEKIIRNMFAKNLCFLHVLLDSDEAVGMAITGNISKPRALLIDYIAIRTEYRGHGIGSKLLDHIKNWCTKEKQLEVIIIEVESDHTAENQKRIQFWRNNDFQLTEYIHHYIWVPEPYLAMYCKLAPDATLPTNGEALFQYIVQFHKESFSAR